MEKINFQNGITPLNDTNLNQIQDNVENAIEEKHIYSTEEQVIGTWINGKPLYRKVIEGISINDNTATIIPTNIANAKIVSINGVIKANTDSDFYAVPYIVEEKYLYVNTCDNGTNLRIRTNDEWEGFSLTVILEYTKTTD